MTYIPTTRTEWNSDDILNAPIDGGGIYLRYEAVYDDIKEARREDDPQLSQGVWQTDLKRANWIAVEYFCVEALQKQTRDLQLALWLTEALVTLDGPNGFIRGLELTYALSERFWDTFHPIEEDFRIPLWEWVDQELNRRLILLPITHKGHSYNDWLNALNLESIRQRAPQRVPPGALTIITIRKELENPQRPFSLEQLDALENIIEQLRTLLDSKHENAPGFTVIRRTLQDMRSLCKPIPVKEEPEPVEKLETVETDESNEEPSGEAPVVISERSHAYQAIRDIGAFLAALEPHSPVPQLLLMAGKWENASLPQILSDVQQTPDTKALLTMLSGQH